MRIDTFEMERMQSLWENVIEYNLSESGVMPVTLRELVASGLDLDALLDTSLGYSQSNGTIALREKLAALYPGATIDNIEVTNGTSEANYLVGLTQLQSGDALAFETPNYMQLWGESKSLGADVRAFSLQPSSEWEPNWDEFERATSRNVRLVYVSNPNNPSGAILSTESMQRIVRRCEEIGAYLIADEVYAGAEIDGSQTQTFWGLSERVIVTSGLSKSWGIPGVRIGWIVGPRDVIADCWAHHDYLTICPSKLSDEIAQIAVTPENRARYHHRTRTLLSKNVAIVDQWAGECEGVRVWHKPRAGAICLVAYDAAIGSVELAEQIRSRQSTLVVPGLYLGIEGYIRIWFGGEEDYLREGLRRVGLELTSSSSTT